MPNAAVRAGAGLAPTFPIGGLLGILFVALKLCHVIGWSWWWVTVPFWGPLALVLLVILGIMTIGTIVLAVRMSRKPEVRIRRIDPEEMRKTISGIRLR